MLVLCEDSLYLYIWLNTALCGVEWPFPVFITILSGNLTMLRLVLFGSEKWQLTKMSWVLQVCGV
jgi:hypothetical protein